MTPDPMQYATAIRLLAEAKQLCIRVTDTFPASSTADRCKQLRTEIDQYFADIKKL